MDLLTELKKTVKHFDKKFDEAQDGSIAEISFNYCSAWVQEIIDRYESHGIVNDGKTKGG